MNADFVELGTLAQSALNDGDFEDLQKYSEQFLRTFAFEFRKPTWQEFLGHELLYPLMLGLETTHFHFNREQSMISRILFALGNMVHPAIEESQLRQRWLMMTTPHDVVQIERDWEGAFKSFGTQLSVALEETDDVDEFEIEMLQRASKATWSLFETLTLQIGQREIMSNILIAAPEFTPLTKMKLIELSTSFEIQRAIPAGLRPV